MSDGAAEMVHISLAANLSGVHFRWEAVEMVHIFLATDLSGDHFETTTTSPAAGRSAFDMSSRSFRACDTNHSELPYQAIGKTTACVFS